MTTRCREIITYSNFVVKNKLDSVIYRLAGKLRTERVYLEVGKKVRSQTKNAVED